MKTDFSQPKFTGARFDEHTLPVDVARDLAAYESLIIDLAKSLYLADHPDRQRVPRGFAVNFRLDIQRIDSGSTKPLLALVIAGALPLQGGEQDYFERARDLISECIAAPLNDLPVQFPKELLRHFNQLGRSLLEDESLELPLPGQPQQTAVLTQDRRKQLVLAAEMFYEREVTLSGYIEEVDFAKQSFRLRLTDGGQATATIPMTEGFHAEARECAGHERHVVTVRGIGSFDAKDEIQKMVAVESIDATRNQALSARFDEIAQLKNGWFNGFGSAPQPSSLARLAGKMVAEYPSDLPIPQVVPTQDGDILFEWNSVGEPSLDINLRTQLASFHAFQIDGTDSEAEFDLSQDDWTSLFSFLSERLKDGPA